MSTRAGAQSAAQPHSETTTKTVKAPAKARKPLAAAANVKAARVAPVAVPAVAAASVIVLDDGIVANSAAAQIQPPAPGFVYER